MKKKYLYMLIIYVFSVLYNIIPSIKYPDFDLNVSNLLVSITFVISFFVYFKIILHTGINKTIIVILILSSISGIFIHLIYLSNNTGALWGLSIVLYIVFISPFFGFNSLMHADYSIFAIFVSLFYIIIFFIYLIRDNVKLNRGGKGDM